VHLPLSIVRAAAGRPDRLEQTALDGAALAKELKALPAGRVLLFLDACHAAGVEEAGGTDSGVTGKPYAQLLTDMAGQLRLFVSCGSDELSYEDPLGVQAGVFSYYLAEALSGAADTNRDGVVRMSEVVEYVGPAVQEWCKRSLEAGDRPQRPQCLPGRWREALPLAFDPLRTRVAAARAALERLGTRLAPAERREAEATLRSGTDSDGRLNPAGAILADWLIELGGGAGATSVTLEQYRAYRRALGGEVSDVRTSVYRLLPPAQALAAEAGLAMTGAAGVAWREQTALLAKGKLSAEGFADWMDDWLRGHGARAEATAVRG
jgi:hypothetical protein